MSEIECSVSQASGEVCFSGILVVLVGLIISYTCQLPITFELFFSSHLLKSFLWQGILISDNSLSLALKDNIKLGRFVTHDCLIVLHFVVELPLVFKSTTHFVYNLFRHTDLRGCEILAPLNSLQYIG